MSPNALARQKHQALVSHSEPHLLLFPGASCAPDAHYTAVQVEGLHARGHFM